jgi:predicted nucleic acid-binding protein
MNLVVDTSVLIAVLVSEPEREKLVRLTKNADLVAPGSVHWEIGNALAAMIKRKRIDRGQAQAVLKAYERIPIRFRDVDLDLAMQVASDHDLYAYDAYVLVCAREHRCPLITLDRNLAQAAKQARVSVVEVPR